MPARPGAGRKPKPTKLRLAQGNPGKRKTNDDEPQPPSVVPAAPDFLGDEALAEWDRIVEQLEPLGILTQIDRAALAAYCDAFGRWEIATKAIQKHGATYETPKGDIKRSPWTTLQREALAELRQFVVEFGMTPSSRTRIKSNPPPKAKGTPGERFFGLSAG